MVRPLRGGGGLGITAGPLREKNKALVVGPLVKELFLRLPVSDNKCMKLSFPHTKTAVSVSHYVIKPVSNYVTRNFFEVLTQK